MNDFDNVYDQMKMHGMELPARRISISVPGARPILENCLRYFLSFQGTELLWQPEYDEVAKWLEGNDERGLFMYGDCGRGKSLLTRYVLPAILLKYTKKVVSVYDVQGMNKSINEVLKKHIIALDDIGTEEVSVTYGNKRLAFAEIIDAAEKQGKLVIISTNLKGNEISERYGQRVMERIVSTTKRIEFKGKSLRQ